MDIITSFIEVAVISELVYLLVFTLSLVFVPALLHKIYECVIKEDEVVVDTYREFDDRYLTDEEIAAIVKNED